MSELRKYRVAFAVIGALAVVTLVFHTHLLAWFSGEHTGGDFSAPVSTTAGSWKLDASVEPDPPRQKGNRMRIEIHDAAGKLVEGAEVSVTYDMAAMGSMPEMKSTLAAKPTGQAYEATFDLPMSGSWTMTVAAKTAAASATARYTLTVGTKGLTALDSGASNGNAASDADVAYYTCSMHPSVHAHEPGKCPICSMDLQAVTKGDEQSGVVQLDAARQKAIGVRTEKAVKAPMSLDVRAVGKLAYDETRLSDVVLKVDGYISGLRVTVMGQAVTKGQTLFQVYSPELFAAKQDYVLARSSRDALGGKGDELVRAAETRLGLLGLTPRQIESIAQTGKPIEKLAFTAPSSGYVIEKNIVEGAAIKAGERILRLAALDKVWVEADVFEADLGRITKGQIATIALSYIPDKTFEGKVTFIYPYLDPSSRTGRVRIELPNQGLDLKPDMYANVTFHVTLGDHLQIPASAIMFLGPRKIVIVDVGDGRLAPREVTIGAQSNDRAEVLSGLNEGDAVVTAGNFLIAAESRIRASGTFWKDAP
ncbi:MAG TPA: efflux RND transporter periplasmic adaptor subunit [Kofleriaceae bacterium]